MTEVGGWYLPGKDSYFARYVEGPPGKRNGFQRDHLLKAFEFVTAWGVAVDVGAHVGFWTRDMAERFAEVHAFEPAEDTFACLEKNTADLTNVHLRFAAVGDQCGVCNVEEDGRRLGNTGARFVRPGQGVRLVLALDDVGLQGCNLLKVDVEGFELQVLMGAQRLIAEHKPVIIMETDKKFSRPRYGIPTDAAEKHLLARGYREVAHMRPDKVFVAS